MDTGSFYPIMSNQPKSPYFHREGKEVELRIPLDRLQKKTVRQFIEAIPDDESTLALFMAESGIGILETLTNPDNEGGEAFCNFIETTPQSRLEILARLHGLGWVNDSTLAEAHQEAAAWAGAGCPRVPGMWDDLAEDIRAAIKKGGREPEEMKRLQALLAEIEGKIEAEAA
jgi:hypothetical protein